MKTQEKVGYKNPPKQHQFQPGVSGNPAGRPSGRGFLAELTEVLNEVVEGPAGPATKQRVLIENLIDDALRGERRALALVLPLAVRTAAIHDLEDAPEDEVIADGYARSQTLLANPEKQGDRT